MRRFIAGAKCPSCHQEDTLFFDTETKEDEVACTRCDYAEIRDNEIKHVDAMTNETLSETESVVKFDEGIIKRADKKLH